MENIIKPWKECLKPLKIAIIFNLIIFIPLSVAAYLMGNPFESLSYEYAEYSGGILFFLIVIPLVYLTLASSYSLFKVLRTFNVSLLWSRIFTALFFLVLIGMLCFGIMILFLIGSFGWPT